MPYKDKEKAKERNRQYQKEWYQRNKAKKIAQNKVHKEKQRKEAIALIQGYKLEKGCCCCEESEPICLDFHHANGEKEINISEVIGAGWAIARIQKEIDKCIVICSNCHRKLHAGLITV